MLKGGMRNPFSYLAMAVLFWGAVHESGVHATLAGVVLGIVTPARSWFSEQAFAESAGRDLRDLRHALDREDYEAAGATVGRIEELALRPKRP